jgi:hypothetical protein
VSNLSHCIVICTSISVWYITIRANFGKGILPVLKSFWFRKVTTCGIIFLEVELSKFPYPSTTTLRLKLIHLLYSKVDINFVLGRRSWPEC